jgi:stage II sporulation protein R
LQCLFDLFENRPYWSYFSMDGVFMFKMIKIALILALAGAMLYFGTVISDKKQLRDSVLRLHVIANSDSQADQEVKLKVRDAVLEEVNGHLDPAMTKQQAREVLEGKLKELEEVANMVLRQEGMTDIATVTLGREEYPTREYDTFTLPAGVYDSLIVSIGEAKGQNWWCVVFPSLCLPAVGSDAADVAAGAGFSDSLSGAITGREGYQVRFFLLDWLGKIENFFW